jgi:hypothetical protein
VRTYSVYTFAADENDEIFAPGALDGWVGCEVPWTFKETEDGPALRRLGTARVVAAGVEPDGRSAYLLVELVRDVEDVELPALDFPGPGMSFAVTGHGPASGFPVTGDRAGDRPITVDHEPGSLPDHNPKETS